jgi:hypothetical protein
MNKNISLISVNIDWKSMAKEAIDKCPKIKKEREKEILYARFGLESSPETLQAVGNKHDITRERVRQIVNGGLHKISAHCVSDGAKKAIKVIEDITKENGGYISFKSLTGKAANGDPKQGNGIRFIANLSKKLEYVKNTNENVEGWRLKGVKLSQLREINKRSMDILKSEQKTMTAAQIAKIIGEKEGLINASLSANNKVMQTADKKWGLISWPEINPKSIRDKSRYVMRQHGKPIHYHDLSQKISEIGKKDVTKQSVHNELIKNNDFILVGRGIYALSDWGYTPGIVEEVIVTVLEEAGEPLHKDIIISKVLERRIVKPSTIVLNLQKTRFKKIDKSVYTLN